MRNEKLKTEKGGMDAPWRGCGALAVFRSAHPSFFISHFSFLISHSLRSSFRRRAAFTLVEIMVASAILGLVMASLFVTFRTGMNAYRGSMASIEKLQTARYVTDILTRDLRSVFFKPHVEVNRNYLNQERLYRQQVADAIFKGDEPPDYNPLDYMIRIDLTFSGAQKQLSFVRFQPSEGDMATQPWSLARVEYRLEKDKLIRSEKPVFDRAKTDSGLPVQSAPKTEISEVVGENIAGFSIHYGFFYEGQWQESAEWQSSLHRYRNPPIDCDPDDPIASRINQLNASAPFDNLPTYVDIELTVADAHNAARNVSFRHLVVLPPAEETTLPVPPDIQMSAAFFGRGATP